ncbi:hypothetical protein AGMMS49983_03170 [Clostridia bacterium]|nr:hypothetical protein AGMMS49983_03170 [Clostridia bacterium]
MKPMRKKIATGVVKGMIVLVLAAPFVVFAIPLGVHAAVAPETTSGSDIKIEYRYTEGEEGSVSVPDTIERYGRTYRLTERQPAVQEATLAATRTYTWSIDSFISEEEAARLKTEIPGLTLTPVTREGTESADKTVMLAGLPTNDVDAIDYTIQDNTATFRRAAVRFDLEKDENGAPRYDEYGLPASYTAEVVYRGLIGVPVPGYYTAAQTYETESLGGVAQYVIVATYSPAAPAIATTTTNDADRSGGTGGGAEAAAWVEETGPVEIGSLTEVNPTETAVIPDADTPQATGSFSEKAKAILFTVLNVVLIAIAAFGGFVFILILRNKIRRQRRLRARTALAREMEYNSNI